MEVHALSDGAIQQWRNGEVKNRRQGKINYVGMLHNFMEEW